MGVTNTKLIDHKRYRFFRAFDGKHDAQKQAKILRSEGANVRVIPIVYADFLMQKPYTHYVVYVRR